ncbi:MAG: class II fructose-bisphosphate aldolase [bacterium]
MIVHIKKIIGSVNRGQYAIGAFNTYNLESTIAILRAAEAAKSPAIIQISEATVKYAGLETIFAIIEKVAKAELKKVPVAIHLDHGKDLKLISECIKVGLSSVHMDASALPFEENIATTKKAVQMGHAKGVWVQGELGCLFGKEGMSKADLPKDRTAFMTDPSKASEFVKRTGIDTLAVAVGTIHGFFEGEEKIDFGRLSQIVKNVRLPLVLHGGSGVSDVQIKKAVAGGVGIINIDTELRMAFTETLRQTLKKEKEFYDPRKLLLPSIDAVSQKAQAKMAMFGSAGKIK